MLRGPGDNAERYLLFFIQLLGDSICNPHLLAHAAITLDIGSPTFLSGWDANTTTSPQTTVQTLDDRTFSVHRGKWRQMFRTKGLSALKE